MNDGAVPLASADVEDVHVETMQMNRMTTLLISSKGVSRGEITSKKDIRSSRRVSDNDPHTIRITHVLHVPLLLKCNVTQVAEQECRGVVIASEADIAHAPEKDAAVIQARANIYGDGLVRIGEWVPRIGPGEREIGA